MPMSAANAHLRWARLSKPTGPSRSSSLVTLERIRGEVTGFRKGVVQSIGAQVAYHVETLLGNITKLELPMTLQLGVRNQSFGI